MDSLIFATNSAMAQVTKVKPDGTTAVLAKSYPQIETYSLSRRLIPVFISTN